MGQCTYRADALPVLFLKSNMVNPNMTRCVHLVFFTDFSRTNLHSLFKHGVSARPINFFDIRTRQLTLCPSHRTAVVHPVGIQLLCHKQNLDHPSSSDFSQKVHP